jgi:septal ring factor EnvC (AmiA/AmiB activator)
MTLRRISCLALAGLLIALCCPPSPAFAQREHLEKALQQEKHKADERKSTVQQLAAREKALAGQLAEVDKRAKAAQERIAKQEHELDSIRSEEKTYAERYNVVRVKREQAVRELRRLLDALWPLHAQGMHEGARLSDSWDASDRRFQWTSSVYAHVRDKLDAVRRQERELADVLAKQKELEGRVDKQLASINAEKDALLKDQLALNFRVGQVSAQRRDLESELQDILKSIKQLNYQLASQRTRKFEAYKNALPWPSQGRVVSSFAPDGRPAKRGLGIATAEATPVRSVFWGKVVHSDVLRGLGKVVIVYHGNDYYSLYAYLSDVEVETGQEVEKDEPLGHAGYYPEAHGSGVYFELRFHQKPINPLLWLAPGH